jgi:hypothetical protein
MMISKKELAFANMNSRILRSARSFIFFQCQPTYARTIVYAQVKVKQILLLHLVTIALACNYPRCEDKVSPSPFFSVFSGIRATQRDGGMRRRDNGLSKREEARPEPQLNTIGIRLRRIMNEVAMHLRNFGWALINALQLLEHASALLYVLTLHAIYAIFASRKGRKIGVLQRQMGFYCKFVYVEYGSCLKAGFAVVFCLEPVSRGLVPRHRKNNNNNANDARKYSNNTIIKRIYSFLAIGPKYIAQKHRT